MDCHKIQDAHTTKDDYIKLYNRKQELLRQRKSLDEASNVNIEAEIKIVLQKLVSIDTTKIAQLSYEPVNVNRKISNDNLLLRQRIISNVVQYFLFVQETFNQLEATSKKKFNAIASEVKNSFTKMDTNNLIQEEIFDNMILWLKNQTQGDSTACEIIISYFIQNCEVFDAITK
jgi:hypothetical protein